MSAVITETALDRFVSKTRALFARESDPEKRWTQLDPILIELLDDPEVQAASKRWPPCEVRDKRFENFLFYEDPDYGFVVNGLVMDKSHDYGVASRIHDHGHLYTLYGLLVGRQGIQRYERVGEAKPEHVQIRKTTDSVCNPGMVDLVRPFEIHSEDAAGDRVAAIVIRSAKAGSFLQGRYNEETGAYWQGYGPRQLSVPFY